MGVEAADRYPGLLYPEVALEGPVGYGYCLQY